MERQAAVFLDKARESLETAESEFEHGRYNSCANRCYYACFQAAIAALLREGIRATGNQWGHDFVQAQFNGELINRRKRFSGSLRQILPDNQALRDVGDYGYKHVTETEAGRALRKAQAFVAAVEQRSEMNR
jgi:uncharacterized protein (UPF0332 family)